MAQKCEKANFWIHFFAIPLKISSFPNSPSDYPSTSKNHFHSHIHETNKKKLLLSSENNKGESKTKQKFRWSCPIHLICMCNAHRHPACMTISAYVKKEQRRVISRSKNVKLHARNHFTIFFFISRLIFFLLIKNSPRAVLLFSVCAALMTILCWCFVIFLEWLRRAVVSFLGWKLTWHVCLVDKKGKRWNWRRMGWVFMKIGNNLKKKCYIPIFKTW